MTLKVWKKLPVNCAPQHGAFEEKFLECLFSLSLSLASSSFLFTESILGNLYFPWNTLFQQNIKTFSIRSCIGCTYNCKIPTLVVALSLTFLILFVCFLFCKPKGSLYTSLSCYLKFKSYLYINYIISDFTLYRYMLLSLSFYPSRISVPPPPPSPGHNSSF